MGRGRGSVWMRGAVAALLAVAVAGALAADPARAHDQVATCSWPLKTTVDTLNVAFPDASATYWTTPFTVLPSLSEIILDGTYADARYLSVNVYNNAGSSFDCGGRDSGLADFATAPDAGSRNPFQQRARPGGAFTVSIARAPAAASSANFVPFPLARCTPPPVDGTVPTDLAFLVFRVYLPTGGDAAVTLPSLKLRYGRAAPVELPPCAAVASTVSLPPALVRRGIAEVQPCGRPGAAACPPDLTFFRPTDGATGGFFPNTDNKYVGALVRPRAGRLVVVRARAASFPPGTHPAPWPAAADLRYWSLCVNVYRRPWPVVTVTDHGRQIVGCTADLDTPQDEAGFYTYVVSRLRDRPSARVLGRNHAAWLPFSRRQPEARHLLILRNMLGDAFPHSVQNCTPGSAPADIRRCAASMGAYYPQAAECAVATFVRSGTAACFAESRRRSRAG